MNINKYKHKSGFTIVELLVVIVVIAILASITIVSFIGINQKAKSATLKADLSNAAQQLKLFELDHDIFPSSINTCPATSSGICLKPSGGNNFTYVFDAGSPTVYTLYADNGERYVITNTNNVPALVAPVVLVQASGGNSIITSAGYTTHMFTSNGNFTVTVGGSVEVNILGAGGGAAPPTWEDNCGNGSYGDGTDGGYSKVSKSGVDWQANGGFGGKTSEVNYCGGTGTSADGAVGNTNTPAGWTAVNGGGALGGSKNAWSTGWELYGGNGGAGGKLSKVNVNVSNGDIYTVTVGAAGRYYGNAGSVSFKYASQ